MPRRQSKVFLTSKIADNGCFRNYFLQKWLNFLKSSVKNTSARLYKDTLKITKKSAKNYPKIVKSVKVCQKCKKYQDCDDS